MRAPALKHMTARAAKIAAYKPTLAALAAAIAADLARRGTR